MSCLMVILPQQLTTLIHHNNISYIFLWREEELEKVFDEYLMKNYELKEGKKYLKYTQDEYERIEKNKFNLKKDLEEQGYSSSHLD